MVREPDATRQPTLQDNQLMSKRRVLSFKPQLRLEGRGQDGQSETEQPNHSASLGDSITSSTRIRFSVHTTMDFLQGLRSRVIGQSEISTDGFHPYRMAIRDAFGDTASHGVIVKTYSVTQLVKEAQGRYSPAAVVAVSKEVVSGEPDQYISTSYVERQNLSLRIGSRRFTRLTNGFSKKLDNHVAAVALYVAHYNLCRVHEALKTTPAKALGVADRTWAIGELIDAALATQPIKPVPTAPERRKTFRVIEGGKK